MDKTTELFCLIDDFCQQFEPLLAQRLLDQSSDKQHRNRTGAMSLSEMTSIVVLFHTMRGRQFKEFHRGIVCRSMTVEFPRRLSYTTLRDLNAALRFGAGRLVSDVQGRLHGPVDCRRYAFGRCHNLRIQRHRVFNGIPQRGKSSTG